MNSETFKPATFRFKFSDTFQTELNAFAQLHRYDNRHCFKEAWEVWVERRDSLVSIECERLKNAGYIGNPIDKMYKSARYYFRKKKNTTEKPKQRRKYVSLEQSMIELMDEHVLLLARNQNFKPSNAFDNFCDEYQKEITDEITRLYTQKYLTESEISEKIKKTYKNRYFQKIKSTQC